MAYLLQGRNDGGIAYPNKAGEFCGNHYQGKCPQPDWSRVRRGRPRSTSLGTTAQLEAQGTVGLYLRHDVNPYPPGYQPVDGPVVYIATPESLQEPS